MNLRKIAIIVLVLLGLYIVYQLIKSSAKKDSDNEANSGDKNEATEYEPPSEEDKPTSAIVMDWFNWGYEGITEAGNDFYDWTSDAFDAAGDGISDAYDWIDNDSWISDWW